MDRDVTSTAAKSSTSALVHIDTSDMRDPFARYALVVRAPCAERARAARPGRPTRMGTARGGRNNTFSVRKPTCADIGMADLKRVRLVTKRKVRLFHGRSQIYAWLRAHHSTIEALRLERPCLWAELALDMVEDGVLDAQGENPSRHNVRMTWPRVCRDVEAASVPARRKYPSRVSPDWRPQVVQAPLPVQAPPPVRPPLPVSPSTASSAPAAQRTAVSAEVQAKIDRVLEQLGEEDRKKFRFGG